MKRYDAQMPAPYGLYVCARALDVRFVSADGEPLGGIAGARYLRVPTPLLLLLGPALGGAFVLAFPLVLAFAVVAPLLAAAVRRATAPRHGYVVYTPWQPAAAFFDGHAQPVGASLRPDPDDDGFAALEAEVALRAAEEKRRG